MTYQIVKDIAKSKATSQRQKNYGKILKKLVIYLIDLIKHKIFFIS